MREVAMRALSPVLFLLALSTGVAAQDSAAVDRLTEVVMAEMHAAAIEEMKSFCADAWTQDFVMREQCIGDQKQGYVDAQDYDVMSSVDATIIWGNCAVTWKDDQDRTDWAMMAHCIAEQEAARQRLQSKQ
jgi:hypothetical protein